MPYITQVDSTLWALITRLQGQELQTPHTPSNARFQVDTVGADNLTISRGAFQQTLDYLAANGHFGVSNAVPVASNKDPALAGPVCLAARLQPNGNPGRMVITYILPILEHCQAVGIQRAITPTTTWLLP
ncbi:hypothetical protein ACSMFX_13140 [Pseudomonas mosselii]|uniref:hypothetical protein n=1 Tax=Pseudomonas mosselii TaxID=78327 RepID=UPI003F1BEC65